MPRNSSPAPTFPVGTDSRLATARSAGTPQPLGTKARRLQHRILLRNHSLSGIYWIFDQFVARPFLSMVRIAPLIIRIGPKVRRDHGVPIRRQVFDMLRLVLIHGAKPRTYYMTERYREGAMRDAGELVMRNETKHGLFKSLNRLYPQSSDRVRSLGDKLDFARWCAETGIPHPHPILVVEREGVAWHGNSLDDLDRSLFVKRRRSRGTRGVATYRRTDVFRYLNDERRSITLDQLFSELVRRSRSERLIAQPFLHNHPMIADLSDEALIVFRLLTCLDENLRPVLTYAYLRLMAKLEPNWDVGHIQEFIAPIDIETGTLGQITGDQPGCLSEWFDYHPINGLMVVGRVVPLWSELAQLAIRAHSMVPERVLVGWDIALTAEGPMMLEGNSFADVLIPQRVSRTPLGHMHIGELLDFHFNRLEVKLGGRHN